jgi:hypothetical protein
VIAHRYIDDLLQVKLGRAEDEVEIAERIEVVEVGAIGYIVAPDLPENEPSSPFRRSK